MDTPTIMKQQFKNEDGGWIGVTIIGPDGKPTGDSVAPGETVWLSSDEQMLTANAPRHPKDNPFIPQTRVRTKDDGEVFEEQVTPLVVCSEERYVPSGNRPFPGVVDDAEAASAAMAAASPTEPAAAPQAPAEPPPVPPRAAAAAEAAKTEEKPVEEHAAVVDPEIGEETGAAKPPTGPPPEGEYAAAEEVGTPVPPERDIVPGSDTEFDPPVEQPAPFTP